MTFLLAADDHGPLSGHSSDLWTTGYIANIGLSERALNEM
jgi:hypothetical protein